MIDHTTIHVNDIEISKNFYITVLKPLGYEIIMDFPDAKAAGLGVAGKMDTWLHGHGCMQTIHIAWHADNREQVDAFFTAAIAAGAKDNGKPGIRTMYHPHYYAAFVIDPNGHNIEVVCHKPF
ncbi:MAG: lactoylglutathione lyase protein [Candidatus Parcubacteria bacterium]